MQKSTNRIQALDSRVVDQIAAGEVVERPSHLVKELVENSLDAKSEKVHIEFSDGGRFVQVTDDGEGIHSADLLLALDRYATSKISNSEDLFSLRSFGFRGEALASISAVSKLTLSSKAMASEKGARVESVFGTRSALDFIGHEQGTKIRVEELFANIPARLKFLKSAAAEASQIKTVVKALALANPAVEFHLKNENQTVLFYPRANSKMERANQALELPKLYEGFADREGYRASAVFADPNTTAKTSKNIWLFAQNRWIQDRSLIAAVMEAYRNLLMHGEFPQVCIWLDVPPEQIDVNIHPTKSQVKFLNPSLAFRAVQASLRDSLEKAPWIEKMQMQAQASIPISFAEPIPSNLTFESFEMKATQYPQKSIRIDELKSSAEQRQTFTPPKASEGFWSSLQVLGQAHLTYILCQSRNGLIIVDQHAAHERVLFEKLMNKWRGGNIDIQDFLFPVAIDLTADKVEALMLQQSEFEKMGLSIEQLGPQTVGIKAGPAMVKESALAQVVDKVATELVDLSGSFSFEKMIGDLCASMACHSAIRAGQAQSMEEAKSLLQQMDEFPLSSFCPHGRPVYIEYPINQLEKDFGRIV